MLEMENRKLKEYIEGLSNPLRREDPSFVPPITIAQGSLNDHEAMRNTYQEFGKWIEDISKQAEDFLVQFVQAYDRTTLLMSKIQCLEGVWEEFQPVQDKIIPCLKVLKWIPTSTLI